MNLNEIACGLSKLLSLSYGPKCLHLMKYQEFNELSLSSEAISGSL